jgi:Ulp1 family protease
MYIDIPHAEINYYDSTSNFPTPLIKNFIVKMANKIKRVKKNINIIVNDKEHQKGYTECGMYSMNFLLERLAGKTMYDISQMKIPDAEMNHLRLLLYSK